MGGAAVPEVHHPTANGHERPTTAAGRTAVAGIVLAAGRSERFGANKLLVHVRGKPAILRVVEAALASRLARVVAVLGHEREAVRAVLEPLFARGRLGAVVNADYRKGQSTSVVAGLDAVRSEFAAAMFLMGDQPFLTADVIDRLIAAYASSEKDICYPLCEGARRAPVIFGARFFPDILGLTGDTGAREIIDANPESATAVTFADALPFRDVDRESDLRRLLRDASG